MKLIRIEEDSDVGPKMLSALLEFIYAGEVTVDESHVETLLKVSIKPCSNIQTN